VLVVITRAEAGGAQVHVRDLVLGLADRFTITVAVGEDGFLVEALRAGGVDVRVVPALQREIAPKADRAALADLRALIRAVKPDLVHTHSSKAGILGRLAARLEGVPALHTAHAWSFSDGIAWRRKAVTVPVEALVGRVTDRFVVVSEADREVGTRWRVARPAQVRVVHNGVADSALRADPGAAGPPRLTMVARLAAPKQPVLLLEAFAAVGGDARLDLVGDGPDRPAVEAAVARLGLGDRVTLLGNRRDVPALLARSQVFALISRQEGFPLAILEAMRAGLPVIASDVGGVSEAVEPGRTGLLVPRDDRAALTDALRRLLGDPDARREMGGAGRAAFEARFTLCRMLDATAAVYSELIPASSPAPRPSP
jgi:glycosyltransferase involved in cell wall biosynthesis